MDVLYQKVKEVLILAKADVVKNISDIMIEKLDSNKPCNNIIFVQNVEQANGLY